jgi:uncharacterized protein (TIGR03083 family)
VIIERDVDCGALYDGERRALIALLLELSPAHLATRVPATPAWSVHDVVAHLVGIAADLNAREFGSGDADLWTARQVEVRRSRSIGELGEEWDAEAPKFTEGLALFGYELGSHYLGDLLQHASDVHHALGRPRRPDDDLSLIVALDFYLDSFHQTLVDNDVGSVALVTGGDRWELGAGERVATLTAGRFEVFRALGGRRSLDQVRGLHWTGDVERVSALMTRYDWPEADLSEG